jgi:hypothetical protein
MRGCRFLDRRVADASMSKSVPPVQDLRIALNDSHRRLLEQKPLATVPKREAAAYGSPRARGRHANRHCEPTGRRNASSDDGLSEAIRSQSNGDNGLLRRFRLRSLSYGGQVAPRNDVKPPGTAQIFSCPVGACPFGWRSCSLARWRP